MKINGIETTSITKISGIAIASITKIAGVALPGLASFISATGGTVTTEGDYKIHTFTTVGNTNFVVSTVVGELSQYYF